MDIEFKCSNCMFFMPNKDKHGTEGACMANPPQVVPIPGRDIAQRPTLTWLSSPRPAVKENEFCRHFQPREEVLPDKDTKHLEN
jgi:hypothetical protein